MKKKAIAMIVALTMLLSAIPCSASYWAYTNRETVVQERLSLFARHVEVPVNTRVYVVGTDGLYYKVRKTTRSQTWYILRSDVSRNRTTARPAWAAKVVKLSWTNGRNLVKRGKTASLYLVTTGQSVQIVRTGGSKHLVGEVTRWGDLDKLKASIGGAWKWKAAPVILKAGIRYIAASIEVDPSSKEVHLYMDGSRSHTTGKISASHQRQIEAALEWAMADDCVGAEMPDFGWGW